MITDEQQTERPHAATAGENLGAGKGTVHAHDFRVASVLPPRELRLFRDHQSEFARALAVRLTTFCRLDVSTRLAGLQALTFGKLAQTWAAPSYLSLFKIEPLRGVCILEIPPILGAALVDRLMGGPGTPAGEPAVFSEIERALLEQAAQAVLGEWCAHWRRVRELKPVLLGQETNGRYVQTASPDAVMLIVSLEVRVGQCVETIQLAFPHPTVDPLIRQLCQGADSPAESSSHSTPKTAPRWNSCFDDVCVPVNAEWDGLEMTARDFLSLKVGDVLRLDPRAAGRVRVRVADQPRFDGRPGMIDGNWAVELTRPINH